MVLFAFCTGLIEPCLFIAANSNRFFSSVWHLAALPIGTRRRDRSFLFICCVGLVGVFWHTCLRLRMHTSRAPIVHSLALSLSFFTSLTQTHAPAHKHSHVCMNWTGARRRYVIYMQYLFRSLTLSRSLASALLLSLFLSPHLKDLACWFAMVVSTYWFHCEYLHGFSFHRLCVVSISLSCSCVVYCFRFISFADFIIRS